MATLRPQIIRADTLDLQDHESPSAQDHSHQPYHPEPLGAGPPAPHQEYSLRHIEQERSAEQEHLADAWGSGRSSHEGSDLLNDDDVDEDERGSSDETRHDDPSMQQNGGESSESNDTDADDSLDDDMDDRISSSPSIPDDEAAEQDEGFVWALHNFVATVEGQANATKGDVMVLLDDSNSYWWLVRVVKDSSIGYLPAEHIETHQERLARYNKHRNLEFAQTMLGDTQEKSKNPLKKAMRRRNAKQVQFSTPTFYDPPSEGDWSDVEEEGEHEEERGITDASAETRATEQNGTGDEIETIGPKTNGQPIEEIAAPSEIETGPDSAVEGSRAASESLRPDTESQEHQETPARTTRNGTMRNTDSFFNDDSAEPRKISLTPNLLRDETADQSFRERSSASQESFEQIEKPSTPADKIKEDRKKKEKKPGMLSGLFKRKDKKIKVDEAAGGVVVKHEDESGSPILTPGDSGSPTGNASPTLPQTTQSTKRSPSAGKLSKAPPSSALRQTNGPAKQTVEPLHTSDSAMPEEAGTATATNAVEDVSTNAEATSRQLSDEPAVSPPITQAVSEDSPALTFAAQKPIVATSSSSNPNEAVQSSPRATDLYQEQSAQTALQYSGILRSSEKLYHNERSSPPPAKDLPINDPVNEYTSLLSSSARFPVPESSARTDQRLSNPMSDFRGAATTESSNRSLQHVSESLSAYTTSSSSSAVAPSPAPEQSDEPWNGMALKAYLDGQSNDDAKNMLILIHNQTDVTPLPLDHPTMLALGYHEQQKRLNEMSSQLDSLLNGFLARRAARPKTVQR